MYTPCASVIATGRDRRRLRHRVRRRPTDATGRPQRERIGPIDHRLARRRRPHLGDRRPGRNRHRSRQHQVAVGQVVRTRDRLGSARRRPQRRTAGRQRAHRVLTVGQRTDLVAPVGRGRARPAHVRRVAHLHERAADAVRRVGRVVEHVTGDAPARRRQPTPHPEHVPPRLRRRVQVAVGQTGRVPSRNDARASPSRRTRRSCS